MTLDRLLNPKTIAVIGGTQAELAIEQSRLLGFEGEIWPIHPSRETMAGHQVYATVGDLPGVPDAALVAVNRHMSVDVVHQLAAIGAGGAVCYAAGFAESGPEGLELQSRLVDHTMPVIGPNCYGLINGKLGAALWPDVQGCRRLSPGQRGAAIITQSGNVALNLTMNTRGLDFTHVVSIGNQAGVRIEDCVAHLAADPDVAAIGLHVESIIDSVAFGEAAIVAHANQTPIVVLKTGSSAIATGIAATHTAAISNPADVYNALFARYGILTVSSVNELAATLSMLVDVGPLAGNRMVSLSCSGGEASLVADRGEAHGIAFAPFDSAQAERVAATLSDVVAITNPLDYHTFIWGDQAKLEACFRAALDGPCDVAMLVLDWPTAGDASSWNAAVDAIADAARTTGTPTVVVATLPENMPEELQVRLRAAGVGVAYSLDEALSATAAAAQAGAWLRRSAPARHTPARIRAEAEVTLDEATGKKLLAEAGIRVPTGRTGRVESIDTTDIEFPIVAKALGLDHKSDSGAVILDIADSEQLSAALARLDGLGAGVLIEEQIDGAVAEILLAVRREWPIGNVLVMGWGGTMVEAIDDTATLLLPVPDAELRAAIDGLRVGRVLCGHRGEPAADVAAIIAVAQKLESLLRADSAIAEIELNPVLALPDGAVAVDAVVVVNKGAV